jgi:hypothetical protein
MKPIKHEKRSFLNSGRLLKSIYSAVEIPSDSMKSLLSSFTNVDPFLNTSLTIIVIDINPYIVPIHIGMKKSKSGK